MTHECSVIFIERYGDELIFSFVFLYERKGFRLCLDGIKSLCLRSAILHSPIYEPSIVYKVYRVDSNQEELQAKEIKVSFLVR